MTIRTIILYLFGLSVLYLGPQKLPHPSLSEQEQDQTACEVIIDRVVVGDCKFGIETGNTAKLIVAVYVDWIDLDVGEEIIVTLNGQEEFVNPSDVSCPNFVTFIMDADGGDYTVYAAAISGTCASSQQSILLPEDCEPPVCDDGLSTGGKIFTDYNGNGIQDSSENGIPNILVKIYGNDQLLTETFSAVNGHWASNNIMPGILIRVEFDIPDNVFDGGPGAESNTRIQIAQSGQCNLSLGIHATKNFIDEDPWIATSYFSKGNITDSLSEALDDPTIVLNKYFTPEGGPVLGPGGNFFVSSALETGSVWGLCYQKESHQLFSSAFLKRQAAWGPYGLGAIYRTQLDDFFPDPPASTDYKYYGRTSLLLNLDDYGIETGDENAVSRDLPPSPFTFSHDSDVFDLVGKWGLGDMDMNIDGDTLFLVNLYNRSLLIINIGNPLQLPIAQNRITEIPIPDPSCADAADWRPWGLKYHQGKIYIGGVCSAESSQNPEDLWAHVMTFDGDDFESVISFNLSYTKGPVIGNSCTDFKPWSPDFNTYRVINNIVCGPSPVLSDIEFDTDGNMLLGIGDRFGYQTGGQDYGPDPNDLLNYVSFTGGDILKLYKLNEDYLLEKNATCGFYTSPGANNNEGVCGGEFFFEDAFYEWHKESALGALALHPSYNTVLSTLMDPASVWSNGWSQLDNSDGKKNVSYSIFSGDIGTFGKAAGLGDIELLTGSSVEAGVQLAIGNYVWIDEDRDGIQDPEEKSVNDLSVKLYDKNGAMIDSTATDLKGHYYFQNIQPETDYYITLGNQNDYAGNNLLIRNEKFVPTYRQIRSGFGNKNNDSDATHLDQSVPLTVQDFIGHLFRTGANNENDFSLDFGLHSCVSIGRHQVELDLCEYDSILFLDQWFSANHLEDTLIIEGGATLACDSIVYVKINVLEESESEFTSSICPGESVQVANQIFDQYRLSGAVRLAGTNAVGCDSTIHVQVNLLQESTEEIDTILCPGEVLQIDNETFDEINNLGRILYPGMNIDGCDSILNVTVNYPYNSLDIQPIYEIDYGDSVQLEPYWTRPFNELIWEEDESLSCIRCSFPWASPLETTDYFLSGLDRFGCPYETQTRVIVNIEKNLYIPNIFSPNGDGFNDFFTVYATPFLEIVEELLIFDRWGNFIIRIEDFDHSVDPLGWDGTFKGRDMNPAVFAYVARVRWRDGERGVYHGDVTLIR